MVITVLGGNDDELVDLDDILGGSLGSLFPCGDANCSCCGSTAILLLFILI